MDIMLGGDLLSVHMLVGNILTVCYNYMFDGNLSTVSYMLGSNLLIVFYNYMNTFHGGII